MHGDDVVVPEPEAIDRGRPEVLADDVEAGCHLEYEVAPSGVFEIDADAPLPEVVAEERVPDRAAERIIHRRERAPARLTGQRMLNLDDLGSEPPEELGPVRQRLHLLQGQDAQAIERGGPLPLSHLRGPPRVA